MDPLKPNKLSNKYLYVFFDTECTQDLEKRHGSFEHVQNLTCPQHMCYKCDAVDDVNVDSEQCGKRVNTFGQNPVGKFLSIIYNYLGHSITRFDTTHSFCLEDFWNLETETDNGR